MMLVLHLLELLCIGNIERFAEGIIQFYTIYSNFLVRRHMTTFLSMALEPMVNSLMEVLSPPVR